MKPNNPAAQLHTLLQALCGMPETNPSRSCFSHALGIPDTDEYRLQLIKRIADMAELVERVESEVAVIPNLTTSRYLTWKQAVIAAFNALNLNGQLKPFTDQIKTGNPGTLERLQFCADLLARERPKEGIEDAELEQLGKEIQNLANETRAAEIDAELKLFILYQLGVLRDAIDKYRIFGREPMEQAANEALGALLLNPEAAKRMAQQPVGEKFWDILKRYTILLSAASSAFQIVDHIRKLLPPF